MMGTIIKKVDINEGMKKMIEENALGLASVNKSGNPHNIAVAYVKVISKNQLLISDNYIQETIKNIKNNPKVALVVWACDWKNNCIGYELAGKAEYLTSGKYLDLIKNIPINKGEPCKGAIVVTLNKIKVLS
jgi:predicted pyridoxine 5'-phosphate oxidase superfamily flavin-nucleotide-binding protein